MASRRVMAAGLGFAACLLAVPAEAQDAQPWRHVDAATGQLSSTEKLEALAEDFPDSSSVRLRLLNALLDEGDASGAMDQAQWLAARGYVFGEAAEAQLVQLTDPESADKFSATEAANRVPVESSIPLTAVPAEAQLVEGVARDPANGCLYVTTVVSRALFVQCGDANWSRIDIPGAGSLSGIAWDAAGGLLWIASGDFDATPGEKVQSALLGFDPASSAVVRVVAANGMVALGDVAVGEDGTVFVSDPVLGIIHYAQIGDETLHALAPPGVFRSPQGMVPLPGTPLLIVSDYRYGLALVDTERGTATRLATQVPLILDGIDGLYLHGDRLIAVQNGTSPMRILELDLAPDKLSVASVRVLESAHPDWTEPTGGCVDGNRFIYVATGQWDRYGPGGVLKQGDQNAPTQLRSLPLGEAPSDAAAETAE